ncbi:MAG TPA: DUF1223 domain-containing protein [Acidiferrobacteraceae bacterium]|nr:DUF1223 domain-containing protein [Acidiferrobacteraceae bacterium]
MRTQRVCITLLLGLVLQPVFASSKVILIATSQAHTVALLELYTSEGCSSCPPAERYVKKLHTDGPGAQRFIPLAFHVDYWDQLGWKDPYSKAAYSTRQRDIARRNRSRAVFTPQIVLHGLNFPAYKNVAKAARLVNDIPARASIQIQVQQPASKRLRAIVRGKVLAKEDRPHAGVYLALYENNLVEKISRGENSGKTLNHDFVVQEFFGPLRVDDQGSFVLEQDLSIGSERIIANMGVVAFVQDLVDGSILQALSLAFTALP